MTELTLMCDSTDPEVRWYRGATPDDGVTLVLTAGADEVSIVFLDAHDAEAFTKRLAAKAPEVPLPF